MDVYKALELMKSQHTAFALVCDEFGSCVGVITLKDILEGLVGNMPGEHDSEQQIVHVPTVTDGWLTDNVRCLTSLNISMRRSSTRMRIIRP